MEKKATPEIDFVITKEVLLRYKGNRPYAVIPDEGTEPFQPVHDMDTEITIKEYIEKKL